MSLDAATAGPNMREHRRVRAQDAALPDLIASPVHSSDSLTLRFADGAPPRRAWWWPGSTWIDTWARWVLSASGRATRRSRPPGQPRCWRRSGSAGCAGSVRARRRRERRTAWVRHAGCRGRCSPARRGASGAPPRRLRVYLCDPGHRTTQPCAYRLANWFFAPVVVSPTARRGRGVVPPGRRARGHLPMAQVALAWEKHPVVDALRTSDADRVLTRPDAARPGSGPAGPAQPPGRRGRGSAQ